MINNLANVNINSKYQENDRLTVDNGKEFKITYFVHSLFPTSNAHTHVHLKIFLLYLYTTRNLISISRLLYDNNINVLFDDYGYIIKDKKLGNVLVKKKVARGGL